MKSLKMGKGTVNYEQCGAVFAKQYKGEFTHGELIAKAATYGTPKSAEIRTL